MLIQSCENLGLLVAAKKTEGPSTRLTVLGIEFDTIAMELRLPADKLLRLTELLCHWRGRVAGSRKELESLAGVLQHASKVVHPGRTFIRRIYNLIAATQHFKPHFTVRLNRECQADVEWWYLFSKSWNGTSILRPIHLANPDCHFWSDASGSWGCGALWKGLWFQVPWNFMPISNESIAAKELFPVLVGCVVWGRLWKGCTVCCHSDNMAAVSVINQHSAKNDLLCHLLRCLFFASAFFDFDLVAKHIPGLENGAADALSRNRLDLFFMQTSNASSSPTPLPPTLLEGLCKAHPEWNAFQWTAWFSSTLTMP